MVALVETDDPTLETRLHRLLRDFRLTREWFDGSALGVLLEELDTEQLSLLPIAV